MDPKLNSVLTRFAKVLIAAFVVAAGKSVYDAGPDAFNAGYVLYNAVISGITGIIVAAEKYLTWEEVAPA
ncbi:MAG: hypothetical protein NUW01_00455 [Gemmatimonadaceae bacterium]|nr:hypothetical protein [Gemmatimonadaceae bacterium]